MGDVTVYIEKQITDLSINHINDTGAALDQYEFCLIGPFVGITDEAIAINADGGFTIEDVIEVQVESADLKAGEDTFGTLDQEVFWDDTLKKFSDTETAGYYSVGHVSEVKDANGTFKFYKLIRHELITT